MYFFIKPVSIGACLTLKRIMSEEEAYHQAMLERQQMLEDALERAETGAATQDDWAIIRFECGVSRRIVIGLETVSITRSEI